MSGHRCDRRAAPPASAETRFLPGGPVPRAFSAHENGFLLPRGRGARREMQVARTSAAVAGYFFGAALPPPLLVNVNVPKIVPTTMSCRPSLFRSTTSKDEPTPDLLCTSSGTTRAPPGALGSRTVR